MNVCNYCGTRYVRRRSRCYRERCVALRRVVKIGPMNLWLITDDVMMAMVRDLQHSLVSPFWHDRESRWALLQKVVSVTWAMQFQSFCSLATEAGESWSYSHKMLIVELYRQTYRMKAWRSGVGGWMRHMIDLWQHWHTSLVKGVAPRPSA